LGRRSSIKWCTQGEKKRQRARKKQPRQDESYTYPMLMPGAFSASHEREAPDSFPFATCASLACNCHTQIARSLFPLSNHISRPIPGSPCSLPSLTKRHSHSPSRISLQNPPPSDPLQIQIYFLQRVCPPNPHLLLLHGPFPSRQIL